VTCIFFIAISDSYFILSDYAARKSGSLHRFRAGENGEGLQDVCSRPAAKTSGVKNIVSTIFFTLITVLKLQVTIRRERGFRVPLTTAPAETVLVIERMKPAIQAGMEPKSSLRSKWHTGSIFLFIVYCKKESLENY